VDNFFEEVLGRIFGRFFGGHRPWRWRPGAFFGGRGALGKMGKCEFALFCSFLRGFGRFLPAFCGNLVLFASMPCAYLYVNNFFPAPLARDLRRLHRRERRARGERRRLGKGGGKRHSSSTQPSRRSLREGPLSYMGSTQRPALSEVEGTQRGDGGEESAKCRVQNAECTANGRRRGFVFRLRPLGYAGTSRTMPWQAARRRSRPAVSSLKPPARGSACGEISLRGLDRPRGPRVRQTARSGDLAASSLPLTRVPRIPFSESPYELSIASPEFNGNRYVSPEYHAFACESMFLACGRPCFRNSAKAWHPICVHND